MFTILSLLLGFTACSNQSSNEGEQGQADPSLVETESGSAKDKQDQANQALKDDLESSKVDQGMEDEKAVEALGPLRVVSQKRSEIEDISSNYINDLLLEDFDSMLSNYAMINELSDVLSQTTLLQVVIGVKAQYGDPVKFINNILYTDNGYDYVNVQMEYEKGKFAYQLVYDDQQRLAGFFIDDYKETNDVSDTTSYDDSVSVYDLSDYKTDDVSFGSSQYPLKGQFILPEGVKDVVVMVHGSGPNDMNETIGPNQVFLDIGSQLAARGIGSLRYDKRTYTYASELANAENFGLYEETVEDAVYAVEEVYRELGDDVNVYVLGHSQGGHAIPMIAKYLNQAGVSVAGYISMAGPVTNLDELIIHQYEYLLSLDGDYSEDDRGVTTSVREELDKVKSGEIGLSEPVSIGGNGYYWWSLINYDQATYADYIKSRVMVTNGSRDYQVPTAEIHK